MMLRFSLKPQTVRVYIQERGPLPSLYTAKLYFNIRIIGCVYIYIANSSSV